MEVVGLQTLDYKIGVTYNDDVERLAKKIHIDEERFKAELKEVRFNDEVVEKITYEHIDKIDDIKDLVFVIVVTVADLSPTEYYCGARKVERANDIRFTRDGLVKALNEKWEGCNADAEALGYGLEDLDAYPQ